jgi:hypothetical protein
MTLCPFSLACWWSSRILCIWKETFIVTSQVCFFSWKWRSFRLLSPSALVSCQRNSTPCSRYQRELSITIIRRSSVQNQFFKCQMSFRHEKRQLFRPEDPPTLSELVLVELHKHMSHYVLYSRLAKHTAHRVLWHGSLALWYLQCPSLPTLQQTFLRNIDNIFPVKDLPAHSTPSYV